LKQHPVYSIHNFKTDLGKKELYINTFTNHLKAHSFIEKPHRHNFYLLVLFTNGTGKHEIDFAKSRNKLTKEVFKGIGQLAKTA